MRWEAKVERCGAKSRTMGQTETETETRDAAKKAKALKMRRDFF